MSEFTRSPAPVWCRTLIDRGEHSARVASVAARCSAEMRDAARASCNAGERATRGHGAPMKPRAGWLQRLRPFGIGARSSGRPLARPDFGRGCSSGVEHDLAKVGVEGSNPFARSNLTRENSAQLRTFGAADPASAQNHCLFRSRGTRPPSICLRHGRVTCRPIFTFILAPFEARTLKPAQSVTSAAPADHL